MAFTSPNQLITMVKVSVIVPIYGAEQYIEQCLHSLFQQTMKDGLEFIFVNDNTPDNSIKVLKHVLESYPNRKHQVKVIEHKLNKGVSTSRQDGFNASTGEYVIHCDPDDWVDTDMYESMYNHAKRHNADMVICDFVYASSSQNAICSQKPSSCDYHIVFKELFEHLHGSCCNKLSRRKSIIDAKIKFDPDLNICEDLLYIASLVKTGISVSYIPKPYYYYRNVSSESSLARKYSDKQYHTDVLMAQKLRCITANTIAEQSCIESTSFVRAWRAFVGNSMSSKEYRLAFFKIRHEIIKSSQPLAQRIALYISSLGLYKQIYNLYLMNWRRKYRKALANLR